MKAMSANQICNAALIVTWLISTSRAVPQFGIEYQSRILGTITEYGHKIATDLPAYSDTVYNDAPLTVILLACPK